VKDQIWLIGFMGTGKSRLARPLAVALDWRPLDIDTMIEQEAGDPVKEIFRKGGETAFREFESRAVEKAAAMANVVVATGGGSVLAEANRTAMRARGFVVCLDARPETILARIKDSDAHVSDRPLLAGGDALYRITELKSQRDPVYFQADFIIQTDELTPDQITHQVLTAFREHSAPTVGAGGAG
jgi:shikimate kinase